MSQTPQQGLKPNTAAFENIPLVKPTGFREYDARWVLNEEINLLGIQALGRLRGNGQQSFQARESLLGQVWVKLLLYLISLSILVLKKKKR